jgi:uncharacterized membrane protein YkoI
MKYNRRVLGVATVGVLLLGSLGIGRVIALQTAVSTPPAAIQQAPSDSQPAAVQQEDMAGDQVQEPGYTSSITVDQTQYEDMSEGDESAALQSQTAITSDQAKAAAEEANPGTAAVKVDVDNENGVLVYSVELSNGMDIKVDAGNAQIVHVEQAGADHETGDADSVQEEFGSQAGDALEVPQAEDASGQ